MNGHGRDSIVFSVNFLEVEEKKRFHFDFSLQVEYFLQPVMLF